MALTQELQAKFDIVWRKNVAATEHSLWRAGDLNPDFIELNAGHVRSEGYRPFPIDVLFHKDVAIRLRDGIRIYADVFRPATSDTTPVPGVITWGPFGKTNSGMLNYDTISPFRCGIPKGRTSGYENFEAPDPAEWCSRGYTVLNIDTRGSGHSEGDISWWGPQEAQDVYDAIEWITEQQWCNGSVAMAGNSWLAISQFNVAARCPHPALKAIAPWEGLVDLYRDQLARGGKPHIPAFHNLLMKGFSGPGNTEDITAMLARRPLYDDYWETKRIPVEDIDVPMYIAASFSSMLHTRGSFYAFQAAKTSRKWLRVHPYFEWYDLYHTEVNDDMQRFFDRYCKDTDNDWERTTPPVRLSVVGFEGSPASTIVERPEMEWPLKRQKMHDFYLDASTGTLKTEPTITESNVSYAGHSLDASADFTFRFPEVLEIIGYSTVTVYMSCNDHDDMDVAVQIRKVDVVGRLLEHLNYPCPAAFKDIPGINIVRMMGPQGFLRASHGITRDEERSSGNETFYNHRQRKAVSPGTVVKLEIPIWPTSMNFAPGEGIMLRISGHDMR